MSGGNAYISLSRESSLANAMRRFSVQIDDRTIDRIKAGETRKYAIPHGRHTVRVAIDFYKSRPLAIDVQTGESIDLVCGDVAPKTIGESLSLQGLGKSLKAVTSPSDYLFVRITGRKAPAEPAVDDRRRGHGGRRAKRDKSIFLSYRREDSRSITGRICDRLNEHFGRDAVFRDVDSIPIGMDFRDKIRETIDQSDLLLIVIGRRWLEVETPDGQRRLDLEDDYVRLEIEEALGRDIPVVPVLVDDAAMPRADQLPESISHLAYRNALFIPREPFFHAGVDKLIEEIEASGGTPEQPRQRFCTGCGRPLTPEQKFCTQCGRAAAPV